MTALLSAHELVRDYGPLRAVDGLSLEIPAGICFGLLGPNGAGKTTTVEMLEGLVTPTSGTIRYRGEPLGPRFRAEAGIMFQHTALQEFITVRETLRLFGRLYPRCVPLDRLIERCALGEFLDRDTRRLSGGQRQRLLLAIALINDPQLVFLDEPTTGLDPQARRNLWDVVRALTAQGRTVVLTTHYMEEAYALCDRIAIMDRGRLIAEGTPRALLSAHYDDTILQLPRADVPQLQLLDGLTVLEGEETIEILTGAVGETLQRLLQLGLCLDRLQVRPRTLEDLFLELTGRELRA